MDAISKIVAQEPQSVAQLFNLYGYDMAVTPGNLKKLISVYGSKELPFSNATGDEEKPKKSFADIIGVISTGATSLAKVINAITGKTPVAESNGLKANLNNNGTPKKADRLFGIDRNVFFLLAILTLVVVGLLIFRKK